MNPQAIKQAAELFVDARRSSRKLTELPADLQPTNLSEALAIQDETVRLLGETVPAWKVNMTPSGDLFRGALLRSRVFASPARVPAEQVSMLGVEAEVAFRFERGLPAREEPYRYEDVAAAVIAAVAIEVLDSRFANFKDTPQLSKIADCVSNGAFIMGTLQAKWRQFDLAKLAASISIDGTTVVRRIAGNPIGDPLSLAVAFAEAARVRGGVRAGTIVTTGSHTGVTYAKPSQTVVASFEDFGSAEVLFTA